MRPTPYRITEVQGDRYSGEWARERFNHPGISYESAAKPKSDLYRDLLPKINSRMVDLVEDARPATARTITKSRASLFFCATFSFTLPPREFEGASRLNPVLEGIESIIEIHVL